MDNKMIAIIGVVVVAIIAIAAGFLLLNNNSQSDDVYGDGAYEIISRVNSEGSGIYIDSNVLDDKSADIPTRNGVAFYKDNGDGTYSVSKDNAAAWGGLVVGTPGTSSIQHVQMATLVSEMGLKFQLYQAGQSKSNDTVYYNAGITNFALATGESANIDGGILWEPQYQRIITESASFQQLALTNNLFAGHTCCVIAASHAFLEKNSDATVAFLAGYAKAVDYINAAMKDKSSAEYKYLVEFAAKKTSGLTTEEIENALSTITYLYADSTDGSLSGLKTSVKDLITGLKDLGTIKKSVDLDKFADNFVDDSYLKKALTLDKSSNNGKITVAVISGDIHQIAVHLASDLGYFTEYGVDVTFSYASNGAGVAVSVQNGEAQMGFLGAPPATITTINSGLISA